MPSTTSKYVVVHFSVTFFAYKIENQFPNNNRQRKEEKK